MSPDYTGSPFYPEELARSSEVTKSVAASHCKMDRERQEANWVPPLPQDKVVSYDGKDTREFLLGGGLVVPNPECGYMSMTDSVFGDSAF